VVLCRWSLCVQSLAVATAGVSVIMCVQAQQHRKLLRMLTLPHVQSFGYQRLPEHEMEKHLGSSVLCPVLTGQASERQVRV